MCFFFYKQEKCYVKDTFATDPFLIVMSTFALLSVTTMPISLNSSDYLKGRGIVQKLFLIIVLITSWLFNSTVMQYRHRSNSPIFHCVAMHTVFHVTSLGAEIRMQSGSLSLICHTDSKTPTAFIFFSHPLLMFSLPLMKWATHYVMCLHVGTQW